jgi:hypothetical protein
MNIKCFAFNPGQRGCAPSCGALEELVCLTERCRFYKPRAAARQAQLDSLAKRLDKGMAPTEYDAALLQTIAEEKREAV